MGLVGLGESAHSWVASKIGTIGGKVDVQVQIAGCDVKSWSIRYITFVNLSMRRLSFQFVVTS